MADEIQKMDLDDAAAKLRDKIKLSFAEAIPDEQWTAMIKEELTRFTTEQRVRDRYGDKTKLEPSGFTVMAQAAIREHMTEQLKTRLASITTGGTDGLDQQIMQWLDDNKASVYSHVFGGMMNGMTSAILQAASQLMDGKLEPIMGAMKGVPDPNNPGHDMAGNWTG